MSGRSTVAVDAASGDRGCAPAVEAALAAAATSDVLLVGPEPELRRLLPVPLPAGLAIRHAPDVIAMGDEPVAAIRAKRRSSVLVTAEAVAQGDAQAMVTPGNTGAAVLAAAVRLRRMPGIYHPALAIVLPSPLGGSPTMLLDVGATVDVEPTWLVQFAEMGQAYGRVRFGWAAPSCALLSNGSEPGKGGPRRALADELLAGVDGYLGLVEGHDLLTTGADVVVTDGLTGNVALKTYEGTARVVAQVMVGSAEAALAPDDEARGAWLAAATERMYIEGGSVVLGLRGVCVICHGASRADDILSGIHLAARCVESDLAASIGRGVGSAPTAAGSAS